MSQQVDWRFWSKVDVGDCWLWTASVTPKGYGKFSVTRSDWRLAHRVAWEILVGPIPEGLTLDHLCRVANCVNPDHLEPVTKAENNRRSPWGLRRASRAKRAATHCAQGHEFTEANTVWRADGSRRCRQCQRETGLAFYHRRRAAS